MDVEESTSSKVLFPAKARPELDWDTNNQLTMNMDFKNFLRRVRKDLESKEIRKEPFGKILKEEELSRSFSSI
ncbi:hypothetical protein Q0590_16190 [Rhodocytophaga aerolata]|uniref:Uncharacterized protein n=1 Tax=Rhodocytophaga aerolata TaxID=455078 RepID=A0ABT8R6T9_9BACT|nr:hypothetical protein [Rhodocytophaga aerolata]MDO1447812.1 hypothetical protein [Rhodocytophaga aerolata]